MSSTETLTTTAGIMTEAELEHYLLNMAEDHGVDALVDWAMESRDNLRAFYTVISKQIEEEE